MPKGTLLGGVRASAPGTGTSQKRPGPQRGCTRPCGPGQAEEQTKHRELWKVYKWMASRQTPSFHRRGPQAEPQAAH